MSGLSPARVSALGAANFDQATSLDPRTGSPFGETVAHLWEVNRQFSEVLPRMLKKHQWPLVFARENTAKTY